MTIAFSRSIGILQAVHFLGRSPVIFHSNCHVPLRYIVSDI